jgi:hypothetical protein
MFPIKFCAILWNSFEKHPAVGMEKLNHVAAIKTNERT